MHDFVTSCIDHLSNIGSLSYANLPLIRCISFIIQQPPCLPLKKKKKNTLLISPPCLPEKPFKFGGLVVLVIYYCIANYPKLAT